MACMYLCYKILQWCIYISYFVFHTILTAVICPHHLQAITPSLFGFVIMVCFRHRVSLTGAEAFAQEIRIAELLLHYSAAFTQTMCANEPTSASSPHSALSFLKQLFFLHHSFSSATSSNHHLSTTHPFYLAPPSLFFFISLLHTVPSLFALLELAPVISWQFYLSLIPSR